MKEAAVVKTEAAEPESAGEVTEAAASAEAAENGAPEAWTDATLAAESSDAASAPAENLDEISDGARAESMPEGAPESCASGEKTSAKAGILLLLALLTIIAAAAFFCSSLRLATLIVCVFTALGCLVSIQYAKKNLGGMSGDIAGYGILWGELMGVFSLMLC